MNILQGSITLYITPKILHVYLWSQWWKTYNENISPNIEELGECEGSLEGHAGLPRWFMDMFEYARHSEEAQDVAGRFLQSGEFFNGD